MTIEDLIHKAAMPAEMYAVENGATYSEERKCYIPEVIGWDKAIPIKSPSELIHRDWIESEWGKQVICICPAKIDGERRTIDNKPLVYLLGLDFDNQEAPKLEDLKEALKDFDGGYYTTKSHQKQKHDKPACDRYRCFLAYSRPVSHEENHRIHDLISRELGHDKSCGDGTRLFYPSVVGCQYGTFGGSYAVDVEHLLSLAPVNTPESPYNAPEKKIGNHKPITLGEKKAHSKHVSFLCKAWPNVKGSSPNTFEDVFQLCLLWIQKIGFDLEALKAALPKVQDIADFYRRNPHQWQGIDATLEKALSIVLNSERNTLSHRNKVKVIDADGIPIDAAQALACQARGLVEFVIDDTDKLIWHTLKNERKAIIDIQCGVGKTLVTSSYVATSADRWIIVKDTNDACRKQCELLKQYGVDWKEIQVLEGWKEAFCKERLDGLQKFYPRKLNTMKRVFMDRAYSEIPNGWTAFYDKQNSPCATCWASTCGFRNCRTHTRVKNALKNKRIVVMTHSRFLELVHWVGKPLEGFRILIDEEPKVFEGVSFASKQIELMLHTFKGCLSGKVEQHLNGILSNPKTGSIEDTVSYDKNELKTLQGKCKRLSQDDKETCYAYLHFMGYAAKRFAFVEGDKYGKKISFARNRLNWTLPNDVYVLSASARFGLAQWDGFTVVRGKDQKEAEGVTVYGYAMNSTKHRMDKEVSDYLKYAFGLVKANGRENVLLALNKEDNQSQAVKTASAWFKKECSKLGVKVMEAERGSIIGRNDWRDCDCVILGYGLFTSVSNVTLNQSLVEGKEIGGARVWDVKTIDGKEVKQPLIRKGMVDKALRETDRRLFADDVYQVGLRGRARNWEGETMDIITSAPGIDYLIPLGQVLPGCKLHLEGLDLSSIKTEDLLKNDKELTKVFGMKSKKQECKETARELAQDILTERMQSYIKPQPLFEVLEG